jgi:hypothetical protein
MKTVIHKITGKVLFAYTDEVLLGADEQAIEKICDLEYNPETQAQFFDFETETFYIQDL